MPTDIFDMRLRALRRDRAFRKGPELFLHQRAFADCLERLALIRRSFGSALLIGCPDPDWRNRLEEFADTVEVADPGPLFAEAAGGMCIVEDRWDPRPAQFRLCVAVGTLDSVNDVPRALRSLHSALGEDSLLIGAIAGGDSLPRLRLAMHAAGQAGGGSSPHVHPRIEASSLAPLLTDASFQMPVVDVDRVQVSYEKFADLVRDLRGMAATNILNVRSRRPLSRREKAAAEAAFEAGGDGDRTVETFEILHFAAWKRPAEARGDGG